MARSRTITGGAFPTFVTGNRNGRDALPGVFLTGTIEPPPVGSHKGLVLALLSLYIKQQTAAPPAGTGTMTVTWTAPATTGITGYNLYYTTGGLTGPWTLHGSVDQNTFTYQFTLLANGVAHLFKVVPLISGVEGSDAAIVDGTPA